MNSIRGWVALAGLAGLLAGHASANGIAVTNTTLSPHGGYALVETTVSWDHSWRAQWEEPAGNTNINWDAAWIFVKYRVAANGAPWRHASLSAKNGDHVAPVGATLSVGLSPGAGGTDSGCGVFLYRSADGSGSWTNTVRLRWNYHQDGVSDTARVDVSVHAIEMVYVPQGRFYVGSGAGGTGERGDFTDGSFARGDRQRTAFPITSEDALTLANTAGNLWSQDGAHKIGSAGVLSASFPKGYNAFYCMKYELSQGQYADFLNLLTRDQQASRCAATNLNGYMSLTAGGSATPQGRNYVRLTSDPGFPAARVYTAEAPDLACNFISWADEKAYADWAGLRPMTELEFEKACRGSASPVAMEGAWGGNCLTAIAITNFTGGADGSGTETALPVNANVHTSTNILGPVRCGIFATANSTRASSGATYWGIMEMSGNLYERAIGVNDATRTFDGSVGDGTLDAAGAANLSGWPSDVTVVGLRGGCIGDGRYRLGTSDRRYILGWAVGRDFRLGFRAVRQAATVAP